jgi:salicylate hydroxylase/6-hydroxynicotinate 3-monooxygenase
MSGGNDDTSWLYGYDAWNVPIVDENDVAVAG